MNEKFGKQNFPKTSLITQPYRPAYNCTAPARALALRIAIVAALAPALALVLVLVLVLVQVSLRARMQVCIPSGEGQVLFGEGDVPKICSDES